MSNTHFTIERIEVKNSFMQMCYLEPSVYPRLDLTSEWLPLRRLLVDSANKHLIYLLEVQEQWEYIRFPLPLWATLDQIISKEQDCLLVQSIGEDGNASKSILLQDFATEGKELVNNMRNNANYGEDMAELVEKHFTQTIQQFV